MKFYTVQTLKAWEVAKYKGYLTGDKEFLYGEYDFMMKQMSKRLKGYKGEYPVWLWLDTSNIDFEELIMDDFVLLEVDIPEENVLLSNFEAWHTVINDDVFDINMQDEVEKQWEYIFDKDKMRQYGYGFSDSELQGVIGRIELENIKVLKYIISEIY